MSKVSYYTEEGLKKLRAELDKLRDIERPKASQAIAEARDKGDLSENAEYDAAKEAQGLLESAMYALKNPAAVRQKVYSNRAKREPNKTARVFFPTFWSSVLSLKLFTTKIAVEMSPDEIPIKTTSVDSESVCT